MAKKEKPINPLGNLPRLPTSFIGRTDEIGEIKQLLRSARWLTLTGPGGCGKTRLAIEVAHQLASARAFENGAWLVEFAALTDAALVPQSIATVLGVKETPSRALADSVLDFLQAKKLLLVFDNCEHLTNALGDWAQQIIDACPHVKILATSREAMNRASENVWLVPSLSSPGRDERLTLRQVAQLESIRLFVDRARSVESGFTLTEKNAAQVGEICQRLEGIPLAIEMAAARVPMLTLTQITTRLDDGLRLLTQGKRNLSRHETLRAALEWSHDLLAPAEVILFRRLAIFAGSFSMEATEAVCAAAIPPTPLHKGGGAEEIHSNQILDLLTGLVDKSLVIVLPEQTEQKRYRMLEPIRQFADEKLRASRDGRASLENRRLGYFRALADQAEPKLTGADQVIWLDQLEADYDNLRAVLRWSVESSQGEQGLGIANSITQFWMLRSHLTEARQWLDAILKNMPAETAPASRAKGLNRAGNFAYMQGDFATAERNYQAGLTIYRALGDVPSIARMLSNLAQVNQYLANYAEAENHFQEAESLYQQSGDQLLFAAMLSSWEIVAMKQGKYEQAVSLGERALAMIRETGNQDRIASTVGNHGNVLLDLGEYARAREQLEASATLYAELGSKHTLVRVRNLLATAIHKQGEYFQARSILEESLAQAHQMGLDQDAADAQYELGRVARGEGENEASGRWFKASLPLQKKLGNKLGVALCLEGLAWFADGKHRPEPAAMLYGAADAIRSATHAAIPPCDQLQHKQDTESVRQELGQDHWDQAFAEGHALTLEQAVERALKIETAERGTSAITRERTEPTLRIYGFGAGRVTLGGRALDASDFTFAKPKELLFYLLTHPPRTKEQIGLEFWQDGSTTQVRRNLGVAFHHLRRALGRSDWVALENNLYSFNRRGDYWYDVDEFERASAESAKLRKDGGQSDAAIRRLQSAIQLYQGDFLQDFSQGDWVLLKREELRRHLLEALLALGALLFHAERYEDAAQVYRQAIARDELLEAAHRELMRCYARLGDTPRALAQYLAFDKLMQDQLGAPPSLETTALYERLRRGEEA